MASDRPPDRRLDLVVGHVLFAPAAGLFLILVAWLAFTPVVLLLYLLFGQSGLNAFGGFAYAGFLGFLLIPVGMALSVAVAWALRSSAGDWKRRRRASRMAAALSLACLGAFVYAVLAGGPRVLPHAGAFTRAYAFAGLLWFPYVLLRLRYPWPLRRAAAWRARAAVVCVVAVAIALWNLPIRYRQQYGNGELLWNDEASYLCWRTATQGFRTTAGSEVWRRVGWFGLADLRPSVERTDLVVVEIGPERFLRRTLRGPRDGRCFIHEGVLHAARGGDPTRDLWRWRGHEFAPLSAADAKRLGDAFEPDEHIYGHGWREGWDYVSSLGAGHRIAMTLGGTAAEVRGDADGDTAPHESFRVILTLGGVEETLVQTWPRRALIGGGEYTAIAEENGN